MTRSLHTPLTILVIDDAPSFVRTLAMLLRREGYTVETADTGNRALARLEKQRYDVILCDLRMPELDGPAFYDILTSQDPSLRQRVIFLTGDTLRGPRAAARLRLVTWRRPPRRLCSRWNTLAHAGILPYRWSL